MLIITRFQLEKSDMFQNTQMRRNNFRINMSTPFHYCMGTDLGFRIKINNRATAKEERKI